MTPEVAAAAVGAGAGVVQQGINMLNADRSASQQYKYNKKLMKLQNNLNMQNWHEQAAYNSVGAQMARLKAAGLNTNLIYGAGADGGIASAAPEVSQPSVDYSIQDPNLSVGINAGMQFYRAQAELENIEAATALQKMQTLTEMYKAAIASKDYDWADRIKAATETELLSRADKAYSDIEVNKANIHLINKDTYLKQLMIQYYPELSQSTLDVNRQQIKESESRINLNASQIKEINSKIALNQKTISKMDTEISKMEAEIQLIYSQKDLTVQEIEESKARIEKYNSEITLLGKQANFTQKEIDYYVWNHSRVTTSTTGINIFGIGGSGTNQTINRPEVVDEDGHPIDRPTLRHGQKNVKTK